LANAVTGAKWPRQFFIFEVAGRPLFLNLTVAAAPDLFIGTIANGRAADGQAHRTVHFQINNDKPFFCNAIWWEGEL